MFFLTSFYWLTLRLLVFGTKNTGTFIVVLLESGSELIRFGSVTQQNV